MQLLDNAVIKDRYEVIVVGSGIGGLTAAAMLAKRGVDVLVVEQHYVPGGACTTMRRNDVTFDVGVAMMFGFGQRGFNPHRFIMNELEEDIEIISHECLYLMKIEDKDLTFWRDFERYFKELTAIFPGQTKELRKLYNYFYKIYANMVLKNDIVVPPTEMPVRDKLKMLIKNPAGTLKTIPLMFKNTESLVKKFIKDPEVKAFFNMLTCTYCYCDAKETPALLSGALFCDNHEGGAYYPSGSPQMLSNKLEKVIEKHGGQMLYRSLVDEILIDDNSAYGIRLSDGTEIMCEKVISNTTVWNLYGRLVRPRHIKQKRMEWAQSFIPTFGSLAIYLGVDAEVVPEGTPPILMFVEDMHNITGNDITIYISSIDDPSLCPEGMHSITIVQPSMIKWPRPFDPKYRSDEYQKLKREETEKLLDQAERHFPDLRKHIRVMDVGTPSTIERFTLKNWGAVGGPKMMMGQDMMKRLHAKSDWKNLYLCGDSTVMGIGIPATSISGVGAANMVLRDFGKKEYSARTFETEYIRYVQGNKWTPSPAPDLPVTEESVKRLARDCQHCEKPGCKEACPAGIETHSFARRMEAGNFEGAARILRETNPLSGICGWICPSEKFCEKNCSRLDFDSRPVRIRELHKWVCGYVPVEEGWPRKINVRNGFNIAVIGAGPAGLTCAHYLARLGCLVDVMEKNEFPGGLPAMAIPSDRLPDSVIKRDIEGLTHPNIDFQYNKALGTDFALKDIENRYDAIFIAPGLGRGRLPDNINTGGISAVDALGYLTKMRSGQEKESAKKVIVIGGGSVAADAALSAKKAGAENVTVISLESRDKMPALKREIDELIKNGIEIKNCWGPDECVSSNKISFIACTSVFDSENKFNPEFDRSKSIEEDYDLLISAIGQTAEPALAGYLKREFGREDRIDVDPETLQVSSHPGIFAGGDIIRGAGTVVQAVGDGRKAAKAIDTYLHRNNKKR